MSKLGNYIAITGSASLQDTKVNEMAQAMPGKRVQESNPDPLPGLGYFLALAFLTEIGIWPLGCVRVAPDTRLSFMNEFMCMKMSRLVHHKNGTFKLSHFCATFLKIHFFLDKSVVL